MANQILKDEAKALASIAEMISREFETSRILICAPLDMDAGFRAHLSKPFLRDLVA